jgi:hypothetical protein
MLYTQVFGSFMGDTSRFLYSLIVRLEIKFYLIHKLYDVCV